ncbi:protein-disulfide reductase DsbD [Pseudogulbenkiania sp. MAI-1]|uniref:protein-disulfide reductase DsbD n=1 Tax=Pseudogulbenkiania sp. MAI-1 TaxID=990370 RepID=UPI0004A48980|nr:protein-disulfide reductase DsbD [Pseudogulbenkiania sp. MAI-1]
MTETRPPSLWRRLALLLAFLCASSLALAVSPEELLPPEKAFPARVEQDGNQLRVTFDIADGYYLYRDRTKIVSDPAGQIGDPAFPPADEKNDPFFGKQSVYHKQIHIAVPLKTATADGLKLQVTAQGCADVGVCYPPFTQTLSVGGATSALSDWLKPAAATTAGQDDSARLAGQGWLATLGTFFLAGLGMAFTACMYPLLPIVSSLIAGQGHTLTRRRGFQLSLTYVQGLALTYTAVGVVAGLTGSLLTVWLQQPAVVLSASALLVIFALSMFDIFSIQLPSSWQTRLSETSNRLSGGKVATVFGMGTLSALIIGPCVAPPLALALGYIGSTGDALLGGVALYAMALGLGLPLILIGTYGGHILPRAGAWMRGVKGIFGVVMLALAIWLATPFLSGTLVMLLWAALCIGSAVFLKTFENLTGNAHPVAKIGKAIGLALFLIGAAQLLGVLGGETNPRYPLKWLAGTSAQARSTAPAFQPVNNVAELEQRLAAAGGKPVLLDFYADWCISCKEMEEYTFGNARVADQMGRFTLLRADVTANSAEHQALLKRFGLFGPPGIILFDGQAREVDRVIGFMEAEPFLVRLQKLAR